MFSASGSVGLDFGTTNSAIATVIGSHPTLAEFSSAGGTTHTFPSVLYFERRRAGSLTRLTSSAGPKALQHYLDAEDKGRLIQSLKAYLADRRFDGTGVFSKHYSLEDMIALIARHLLEDATLPDRQWITPSRVVVGRPVHFSNAEDQQDDEFALGRLRRAIAQCGFTDIVFEYEPVAAAYSYEQTLDRDELILIGDFGGGTSDFSILRVGPTQRGRGRTREDIIGTDGVAVAGDAFDRQIIRKLVAPRLGLGSEYFAPPDKFLPVPSWPYERLERWHHLSFLNTARNLEMLEHLRRGAIIPERLEAFVYLIKSEMGYRLHESVRRAKFELSAHTETMFAFECEPVSITKKVTRLEFETWIDPELQLMAGAVDRLLNKTGVSPRDIDHVFLTGGSSFVPAVRNIFIERFGSQKITGGEELTSVATGLSLCAAREWATPG
ncbi:MAG: Hsp70 family protein [Vicinamibacterales bacterium]